MAEVRIDFGMKLEKKILQVELEEALSVDASFGSALLASGSINFND